MRHNNFTRAAVLAPTTYDPKTRTIEVVLSTGAAVSRYGYTEKLDINGADLRGIVGSPVLDSHSQHTTRAVLGVIQKSLEGGRRDSCAAEAQRSWRCCRHRGRHRGRHHPESEHRIQRLQMGRRDELQGRANKDGALMENS